MEIIVKIGLTLAMYWWVFTALAVLAVSLRLLLGSVSVQ